MTATRLPYDAACADCRTVQQAGTLLRLDHVGRLLCAGCAATDEADEAQAQTVFGTPSAPYPRVENPR